MDRQNKTKALVESSILTAVAVVMILMCIYLPVFILVGMFIWPIPITMIYIRHGFKYSLLSLFVTFTLTSMTSNPITAAVFVMIFGVLGVVLGYTVSSKKTPAVSMLIMSAVTFLSTMAVFKLIYYVLGQDIISQAIEGVSKNSSYIKNIKSMYISMGASKETLDKAIAALPSPEQIKMIMPVDFIILPIVISFIFYIITKRILKRFKYEIPSMQPLSQWYIPSKVSFGIIIIFIMSYVIMNSGVSNGNAYFVNANLIFESVFTLNALAFLSWSLKRINMVKPLRWIIIVIAIASPVSQFLYMIGIFDYVLDYRKLDSSRRKPAQ